MNKEQYHLIDTAKENRENIASLYKKLRRIDEMDLRVNIVEHQLQDNKEFTGMCNASIDMVERRLSEEIQLLREVVMDICDRLTKRP